MNDKRPKKEREEEKKERKGKEEKKKDEKKEEFRKKEEVRKKEEFKKPREDIRYIVRIASRDLNGYRDIAHAITGLTGVSQRYGKVIAKVFERETGINAGEKIGKITQEQDKKLEEIINNPLKYGVPEWMLNRQRNFYTNNSAQLLMGELQVAVRDDIKRMNKTKSYRGLRLEWGLPVRGQRTKSTHRGKGSVVGVIKKDVKKALAPASAKGKE